MILKNLTRNSIISTDLKAADSPIDKFFGLLKKSNPRSLLFQTRLGMHTFFLKNSIDIIILDRNLTIRKASSVKPNKLFFYSPQYPYVVELPNGTIIKSKTEIGDKLNIIKI